jgi:ubiquinone/menaquinone biosynthesis C-methylase UbiE
MGLILYAVLAATFRVVRGDGRLRIAEILRRQGSAEEALDVGGYQAAVAVRRCMMCAHKAQCDEWSGAKRSMEAFCPNAEFIAVATGSR